MLKCLQHCLHQLVVVGNELFDLGVGLVVRVAALAIAVLPRVHHLRGFQNRWNETLGLDRILNYTLKENVDAANFIIIISKKDAVVDKATKQPMTHTSIHSIKSIINYHTSDN
jgi:hypothetical protein